MNVVKISPNWALQLIKITLALLITYILSIATPMEFKSVGIIIFPLFLVISLFNIMQLRFLHCYKAGINYSRGVGKQYINADEIKSLSFRRYAIITEFCQGFLPIGRYFEIADIIANMTGILIAFFLSKIHILKNKHS